MTPDDRASRTFECLHGRAHEDVLPIPTPVVFWNFGEKWGGEEDGMGCSYAGTACLTIYGRDAGFISPFGTRPGRGIPVLPADCRKAVLDEFSHLVTTAMDQGYVESASGQGPDFVRWVGRKDRAAAGNANSDPTVYTVWARTGPVSVDDAEILQLATLLRSDPPMLPVSPNKGARP